MSKSLTNNTVSASAILSGLATIFLPLTQSTPTKLTGSDIKFAIVSGLVMIVSGLVHHGVLSKSTGTAVSSEITEHGDAVLTAAQELPDVQKAEAASEAELKKVEAEVEKVVPAPVLSEAEQAVIDAMRASAAKTDPTPATPVAA